MNTAWINCNDRMPNLTEVEPNFWETSYVLVIMSPEIVYFGESNQDVMRWYGDKLDKDDMIWHDGHDQYFSTDKITHWMPLPEFSKS